MSSSSNAIWLAMLEDEAQRQEAVQEWQQDVPTIRTPTQHDYRYALEQPRWWRFRRWLANVLFRFGGAIAP